MCWPSPSILHHSILSFPIATGNSPHPLSSTFLDGTFGAWGAQSHIILPVLLMYLLLLRAQNSPLAGRWVQAPQWCYHFKDFFPLWLTHCILIIYFLLLLSITNCWSTIYQIYQNMSKIQCCKVLIYFPSFFLLYLFWVKWEFKLLDKMKINIWVVY